MFLLLTEVAYFLFQIDSLSLSHTHTHTHKHTYTHTHSHTHTLTHTHTHTHTLTHTHTHTHTHSLSLSLTHFHTHTLSHLHTDVGFTHMSSSLMWNLLIMLSINHWNMPVYLYGILAHWWHKLTVRNKVGAVPRCEVWVCDGSLSGIAGSNTAGAWISVCCVCCVLSGRGLCYGRSLVQKSPTEWGVSECWREVSIMRMPWPNRGCCAVEKKIGSSGLWHIMVPSQISSTDIWQLIVFNKVGSSGLQHKVSGTD